tara:strand:+ start:1010 stop:1480 length:471 start_codon:yes stop_codon:yes gene_type:complete
MFYTSTLRVPTEPQSWCRSPEGYRNHQLLLQQLVDYLDERGIRVELPVEVKGKHDNGVDLYVGEERIVVDLKSFLLSDSLTSKTRTWLSPFHKSTGGRRATWKNKATELYVHANFDIPVEQWVVGGATNLNMSGNGSAPYYYKHTLSTVGETCWKR